MHSFWTHWSIFAFQNTSAFQGILYYCVIHCNCVQSNQSIIAFWITFAFKEIKVLLCYVLKLHSRNQIIITLQNEFKERKYYWDMNYIQMKKKDQIYYVLIMFEKLHCKHFAWHLVQCTKLHKLCLGSLNMHCCQLGSQIITNY